MTHHTRSKRSKRRGADDGAVDAPPRFVFAFLMLGVIAGAIIAPGERGPLGSVLAEAVGLPGDRAARAAEETSALAHRSSHDNAAETATRNDR